MSVALVDQVARERAAKELQGMASLFRTMQNDAGQQHDTAVQRGHMRVADRCAYTHSALTVVIVMLRDRARELTEKAAEP